MRSFAGPTDGLWYAIPSSPSCAISGSYASCFLKDKRPAAGGLCGGVLMQLSWHNKIETSVCPVIAINQGSLWAWS